MQRIYFIVMNNTTRNAGSPHNGPDENLNTYHVTINLGQQLDERIATAARFSQALKTALVMFYEHDMGTSDNEECGDIVQLMLEFDVAHSWLKQYKNKL
jgi:hypothetical protein